MSLPQNAALTAIVFQFLAAVETYDREVERMLAAHDDLEQYQMVSRRMDEMRLYAGGVPSAGAPWVEVLIRHFELTHGLWRVQQGAAGADVLERMRELHAEAVHSLRRRLQQFLPQQ